MSDSPRDNPSDSESTPSLDLTTTPCGICGPSTCDEQMIGCDGCSKWFHSRCVGVNVDSIPDKWYCQSKACQKQAQEYLQKVKDPKEQAGGQKVDELDETVGFSIKSSSSVENRIKALEEKQKQQTEELDAEIWLQQKERKMQRALKRKKMEMEMRMREEEEEEERALMEEMLQRKTSQVQRMRTNRQSFETQMAELDEQLKALLVTKGNSKGNGNLPPENDSIQDDKSSKNEDASSDHQSQCSSRMSGMTIDTSPRGLVPSQTGPTKAQMAARKGLTSKLPKFSGKPRQWPLFYASYKASNEACGYMQHENLVRLQECLEGKALELVSGQLLLPDTVPRVIEKLRRHYGRPEQLLQEFLDQVDELEPPKPDNLRSFIPFGNTVEQLCEHLEAAGLRQHLVNPLLIKSLVAKIPDREKRDWIHYQRIHAASEPTLRTLTDFLMEIVDDACDVDVDIEPRAFQRKGSVQPANRKSKDKGALFSHSEAGCSVSGSFNQAKLKPCKMCGRTDHRLRYCEDFRNIEYADRLQLVTREKLCIVCLNEHGGQCKFKIRCNVGECREHHNPLMHPAGTVVGMSAHIQSNSTILFRMVPVQLQWGGQSIKVLAFLDEGASVTLLEKKLADRLGVVGVKERLSIKWTANVVREEKESRRMNIWASGVSDSAGNKLLLRNVRTVNKLSLPHQKLDSQKLITQFKYMQGLPIDSYDGQPALLIGLNNIHSFAPLEAKMGTPADPIAVKCNLGWTVYGPKHSMQAQVENYLGYHKEITNEDLHELLRSHYALEESVVIVPQETKEERRARETLERTTKRVGERFETGLLWKTDNPLFPDSYPMALRRMRQLEKRLDKNPLLRENVNMQINDYQLKGYAHLASFDELVNTTSEKIWYLPLNVVQNPKKPDKVRLVWDAAATVQGVSLNSKLLKGPDLLVPLVKVIIGFRERRIAFGGDLKEMFHQLKIRTEDKQAQRFIHRMSSEDPPSIYVMDVATFGATSSPCSAQFVKNRNAENFAGQYPEAAAAIINRHYVDDYFDSVDTIEAAVKLAAEVRLVHSKGGFEIRNWISNSPEVLRHLGEAKPVAPVYFNRDKENFKERVLGVIWDPETDLFSFSTRHRVELLSYLYEDKRPTKRLVASCVMGFFDPLGLLSPFTIHGKIIIQYLWRSKCDWDQEIDSNCWNLWKRWTSVLPEVEAIRIPRCYIGEAKSDEIETLEVHIFTDASDLAYGCVAYLRVVIRGVVQCTLIMSRAKVAPLKRQSIPRLELMGAVLGARLSQTILSTHSHKIARTFLWTDSRTVCSWLHSDQHRYKQFVAFRVGEIWELTNVKDWRWIPTKLNIADSLTKWGQGPLLRSDGEWFTGPAFLYLPPNQWPSKDTTFDETGEEMRSAVLFHGVVDAEVISRWTRLLRVTASVIRFINNCRRKQKGEPILTSQATPKQHQIIDTIGAKTAAVLEPLNREELRQAEIVLWRQVQWDSFPCEMSTLSKNLERKSEEPLAVIKKDSPIYKSSPVLDEEGVLRMDGRTVNANEGSFDKKHPIILSRFHQITQKLIQYYHEEFGHANSETVFNEMRQRFHIPKLRSTIKNVVKKCIWCRVNKCRPRSPRMAPLPVERVTSSMRPFSSVGIDYLGPLEVVIGRRKEKRWVALFTCMAVRAVHLEVVHSLTTESCRMAISRFSSRFGKPDQIFSDNATCFRGANNEIVKMQKINGECAESLASPTTVWHFNPPGTPHMGGIWERMVRSVKDAMRTLDDGYKLTDEILTTTLAKVADMINTRPLTYLPQDSDETEALTPNHFLRGTVTDAGTQFEDVPSNLAEALRKLYKRSQFLAERMWERWRKEYLPTINQRSKWFDEQKPLEIGDLVFVVDGKNRKGWKRGIVEAVIQGVDGRVRQVDVRNADGSVQRRGVVNLAVLEI
ncbi:uncharacterized protein LOC131433969 [Malaya genurostris]|uniref:uncharacterized protein LOC131433968 n=1 Tax=Malaya genurostris TaxID=325434 RepID=UPI0026F39DEC|nr:uncharacterized protein LOC131433968 [Malaya genurostris]XP_058456572.1 uncharacterized protein LOC131433969 [Malaya genurostris]